MRYFKVEFQYKLREKNNNKESNTDGVFIHRRRRPDNPMMDKIEMAGSVFKRFGEVFVCELYDDSAALGVIIKESDKLNELLKKFYVKLDMDCKEVKIQEITIGDLSRLLDMSEDLGFIDSVFHYTRKTGISALVDDCNEDNRYKEYITEKKEKQKTLEEASELPFGNTLIDEINRIYYDAPKKWYGHPVRYIIETNDWKAASATKHLIAAALYSNNRIKSGKYGYYHYFYNERIRDSFLSAMYESVEGSILFVDLRETIDNRDNDLIDGGSQIISQFCSKAKDYANDVLTIFLIPESCTALREKISGIMEYGAVVYIREEARDYDTAIKYLQSKAKSKHVRIDKELKAFLSVDKAYFTDELNAIFEEWFDSKLRNRIYKQYSEVASIKKSLAEKEDRGNAYDELDEMIGLKEVKKIVNEAINMHKAQKIYVSKGLQKMNMSMHMVFTGNPGTAKTTVARLFARILKENEIIRSHDIVEVGRSNLVGKYVGWTAPTIKQKFKEAKGGILFIDEAYSLVDDRDGSYGDEAINTIVQEMENNRKDVIVIFAGYPDKMEQFLDKNPGLRSRIGFHVKFEDYSADELCDISRLIVSKMGMGIEDEAMCKVHSIMEQAVKQRDFGNGRFARNLMERARMAQASRLVKMDFDKVSSDDVSTIIADDIVLPDYIPTEKPTIGFAV